MCGKGVAESNQHGIRLLRIRSLRKIREYPARGEAYEPLPFFVTPSFFRYAIVCLSRVMRARIAFPTAHARMYVTMFAFRKIIFRSVISRDIFSTICVIIMAKRFRTRRHTTCATCMDTVKQGIFCEHNRFLQHYFLSCIEFSGINELKIRFRILKKGDCAIREAACFSWASTCTAPPLGYHAKYERSKDGPFLAY